MSTLLKPLAPPSPSTEVDTNHWVPKGDILRSIVDGVEVAAICGELITVGAQHGGSTSVAGAPICEACKAIYAGCG